MKRKMKLFGSTLIVVFAAMSFFLWGQYNGQTGNGIEIVKRRRLLVARSRTRWVPHRTATCTILEPKN